MLKKALLFILVIALYFLNLNELKAQNAEVKVLIDTNNVLIGDQIKLTFQFKSDEKLNVIWPQLIDSSGKIEYLKRIFADSTIKDSSLIEILEKSKIDTQFVGNGIILSQKFTLTCFDSGSHQIPPFVFMYEKKCISNLIPIESQPIALNYRTVAIDTTQAIKEIKAPIDAAYTIDEFLLYIIIGILVIALIIVVIWYLKKKKKKVIKFKYDPKIPPHVMALQALKQLEAEKLWQKGEIKLYYIRLTEILWVYIERRFDVRAPELTSGEIIEELNQFNLELDLIIKLKNIFEVADLAKFAKYTPLLDENAALMNYAIELVNMTTKLEAESEHQTSEDK